MDEEICDDEDGDAWANGLEDELSEGFGGDLLDFNPMEIPEIYEKDYFCLETYEAINSQVSDGEFGPNSKVLCEMGSVSMLSGEFANFGVAGGENYSEIETGENLVGKVAATDGLRTRCNLNSSESSELPIGDAGAIAASFDDGNVSKVSVAKGVSSASSLFIYLDTIGSFIV